MLILSFLILSSGCLLSEAQNTNCPTFGDSRCLSCGAWVDCSSGTSVIRNCSQNAACGENAVISPPAFCSGEIQMTPDNSNCFCDSGSNGVFEDPYSIYSYVRCIDGNPQYVQCPDNEAFIDSLKACVPVSDCTDEEVLEIPLSCSTKLVCVYEYGAYTGYLQECSSPNEIFNEDDPDYCYVPGEGVCSGAGSMVDPYKCNIWHQCGPNSSEPVTSSCCPRNMIYSEVQNDCVTGQCAPSGLCIQEYWEQEECHQCTFDGQLYETDNLCTPYYFECYLDAGYLEVKLEMCPNPGQLFDPDIDQCSYSVSGCASMF